MTESITYYVPHTRWIEEVHTSNVISVEDRGETAKITYRQHCSKCSGRGTYLHYGTCFRCQGARHFVVKDRVAYFDREAAEAQVEKKERARQRRLGREHDRFVEAVRATFGYRADEVLESENEFVVDVRNKLRRWDLSEAQVAGVLKALDRAAEREARRAERKAVDMRSEHLGEVGDKIEIEGHLEYTTHGRGQYNSTLYKVRTDDGNFVVWWRSGYYTPERGARIALAGTVKRHDEYQGVKQTVMTRCKVTHYEELPEPTGQTYGASDVPGEPIR